MVVDMCEHMGSHGQQSKVRAGVMTRRARILHMHVHTWELAYRYQKEIRMKT